MHLTCTTSPYRNLIILDKTLLELNDEDLVIISRSLCVVAIFPKN